MILVDWQIKELIERTGAIEPFNPGLINPASLDVLMGDKIMVEAPKWIQPLKAWWLQVRGLLADNFWAVLNSESTDFLAINLAKKYYLAPNELVLACTKERFNLPNNISCEFALKSSLARQGLGHSLAVWAFAGFSNSALTLELKNYSRYRSIPLSSGMRIGQLIFHSHESCIVSYQKTGRYNGDRTVQPSKG